MMPYTYPSRTCITHGCLFEKQPHVGDGDHCFKHGEFHVKLKALDKAYGTDKDSPLHHDNRCCK